MRLKEPCLRHAKPNRSRIASFPALIGFVFSAKKMASFREKWSFVCADKYLSVLWTPTFVGVENGSGLGFGLNYFRRRPGERGPAPRVRAA
jgi:hypothetical protein